MKALTCKLPGLLRKFRTPALVVLVLSIVACELPLLLAFLGIAGFFNFDSTILVSPVLMDTIRPVGIVVALISLCYLIYRFRLRIRQ